MTTRRTSPASTGSHKVLWAGMAVVVVLVLVMGVKLLRSQAQSQEPRLVAWPAKPEPGTSAPVANAVTQVASSADPTGSASQATGPTPEASRPRRVQLQSSEPAVARTPANGTRPDAVEAESRPDIKR